MVQRGDNISRPKLQTSFVFVTHSVLRRLFLFSIFFRDSVIESIVFQTYRNGYRSQRIDFIYTRMKRSWQAKGADLTKRNVKDWDMYRGDATK